MAHKKTSNRTAYAVVCTNGSALKLDDETPNFTFNDGEIKDVHVNEAVVNVVEQSIRYVPKVQTICMDLQRASYLCLSLMIEYQGTGTTFHVEEVELDNTSQRLNSMCESLKNLLGKVEVKLIPTSDHCPYEEDIFGDDLAKP